ncbi:MAG: hypothetical protein D6719_13835 [Candidatus Dadabacteria bacterium]|nr:MAG: hypothetical protein D6719_13835 [Candidatus Dadabacteria bacterium]
MGSQKVPALDKRRETLKLEFNPAKALWIFFFALVAVELTLAALDLFVNYWGYVDNYYIRRIFDITREESPVTWVSSVLFLLLGLSCVLHGVRAKIHKSLWRAGDWFVLALIFTYLSLDDGARIHENLGNAFGRAFGSNPLDLEPSFFDRLADWFPSYYWQLIFMPFLAVVGLCMFMLLWREYKSWKFRFMMCAGFGILALSQGLDYFEAIDHAYDWISSLSGVPTADISHYSKTLEETMEMFGLTLLIMANLGHFVTLTDNVQINFVRQKSSSTVTEVIESDLKIPVVVGSEAGLKQQANQTNGVVADQAEVEYFDQA